MPLRWFTNFAVAVPIALMMMPAAAQPVPPPYLAQPAAQHSMAEFSFLIGRWQCIVSEPGRPDVAMSVVYNWLYDGRVLHRTLSAPGYVAETFTTYDLNTNTFKIVEVQSNQAALVWEGTGMSQNWWHEYGYSFGHDRLTQIGRADFQRVSDTHYMGTDFGPDDNVRLFDREDCTKSAS